MTPAMKVLAIPGSVRRDSYNRMLLSAAGELLPADVELELFDELKAVPPYDEDDDVEPAPAAVQRLRAAVAGADALLFATPEYNSSIPGQLKNAVDWASRPLASNVLRNKPAAVIGASTGAFGAVWAQAELRKVLAAAGARVLERRAGGRACGRAPGSAGRAGRGRSGRAAARCHRRSARGHARARPGASRVGRPSRPAASARASTRWRIGFPTCKRSNSCAAAWPSSPTSAHWRCSPIGTSS